MKFIKFGEDPPTLYRTETIDTITLFDEMPVEEDYIGGCFSVVICFKNKEKRVLESFWFNDDEGMVAAIKAAHKRFCELLGQLNA